MLIKGRDYQPSEESLYQEIQRQKKKHKGKKNTRGETEAMEQIKTFKKN